MASGGALPKVISADKVEDVLPGKRYHLGEGALWDSNSSKLLHIDIEGKKVMRFDPETGENEEIDTPSRIGTVVPTTSGGIVVALEDGFYSVDFESKSFKKLGEDPDPDTLRRFNDGKCDPQGRLWAGTMAIDPPRGPVGSLFCLESGTIRKVLTDITVSNGIVWSKDQKTMYYTDTPTNRIDAFDFDGATGEISNRRTAFECIHPDGFTIDGEDRLWVAHWGESCVTCTDPVTKERLCTIELPTTNITSCAFTPNGDLYITSARAEITPEVLAKDPFAGALFRVRGLGATPCKTNMYKE